MEEATPHLHLRLASPGDSDQLLEWANDPEVRQASFQSEPITLEEHQAWVTARLEDSNTLIWLLEVDQSACGMVRLERMEQAATLSYLVASSHRGQGLAAKMLRLALIELADIWPGIPVIAWIRSNNVASSRSLEGAGFQRKPCDSDRLCFVHKIEP